MAKTRRLKLLVESALKRTWLPEGPVSVALSGGADSAVLAMLVAESRRDFSLVHIDHGQEASAAMEAAAIDIAARLGMPLHTIAVEVSAAPSFEAQAREVRYEALATVDGPVVTGHTRDDVIETMLINLVRGTGGDGLAGIPYHRPPNVYRPILEVTRSETREMAELGSLPFRDDPTNDDLEITRNHLRHVVLPRLRELNPSIDEAMARAAASLRSDAELLNELARQPQTGPLEVGLVATKPRPVADRIVRKWLAAHDVSVDAELIARVRSVIDGVSDGQDLEGGRRVVRDRAVVRIE